MLEFELRSVIGVVAVIFLICFLSPPRCLWRATRWIMGSRELLVGEVGLSPQEDSFLFIDCVTVHKGWHNKGEGY